MKIAFVGFGHMGEPMARNLLRAGHSLTVFDVSKHRIDALTAAGAAPAPSAKQAAAQAANIVHCGGSGKDLGLATDAAKQAKHTVVMGAMAQQLYQLWSAQGSGSQDFSAIVNLYKNP